MNEENEFVAKEPPAISGSLEEFTDTEVKQAIHNVNSFKSSGSSGVNTAMIEATGYCGKEIMRYFC